MTDPTRWTRVDGIRAAVKRRWDDGVLLRAAAQGKAFPVIEVPLRHPSATDVGEHFDAARQWSRQIVDGSSNGRMYGIEHGRIGGRIAGVTDLPVRAVVSTFEQAWALLGVADQARAFVELVGALETESVPRRWALARPQRAVAVADRWPEMLAAYRWLDEHRGSRRYLRQIDAPGVDTKFVEHHRGPLAEMLQVSASARGFVDELGLAAEPTMVRVRFDPAVFGFPSGVSEASLRLDELTGLGVKPSQVLIVENKASYLSVPVPAGAVVLWGKGYSVDQPASLAWLADVRVRYWGDIDTHGFGILHRARSRVPHIESVLMDRETMLAHRDRWGTEGDAATDASLSTLTPSERALYEDLVTDRFGAAVRLEQERIAWDWVSQRL